MLKLISRLRNIFRKKPNPKIVDVHISNDNGQNWQKIYCGADSLEMDSDEEPTYKVRDKEGNIYEWPIMPKED